MSTDAAAEPAPGVGVAEPETQEGARPLAEGRRERSVNIMTMDQPMTTEHNE